MDEQVTSPVLFYLTGFGSFPGVEANPTESLIRNLATNKIRSSQKYYICRADVLPVSSHDVNCHLNEIFVEIDRNISRLTGNAKQEDSESDDELLTMLKDASAKTPKVVILHLGVHAGSNAFSLESKAWNEATFRSQDSRGWQPNSELIIADNRTIAHQYDCNLRLESLRDRLGQLGHTVQISEDPGRYVCNWIYYNSLHRIKERPNCSSLFVHVPMFDQIPKTEQILFFENLLDCLATQ